MNPDAYASTALRIRQTGLNPDRMRTVPSWCDARAGRPKSRTTKVSRTPRRAEDWPSTQPIRLSRVPSVVDRYRLVETPGVLAVPDDAVSTLAGVSTVYVIEGNKARQQIVSLGAHQGNLWEIVDGLKGDDDSLLTARNSVVEQPKRMADVAVVAGR